MSTVYDEKLLDKVGLAMVPSGYTNNAADEGNTGGALGKVYSVLPVQTQSEDLVTNGTFDTNTDWTFAGGTTVIANGVAEFPDTASSYLIQDNIVDLQVQTYILTYTIKTSNGGLLRLAGGSSAFDTQFIPNTVGTHELTLTSNGSVGNLQIWNNSTFVGTIDDISLVKVIDGDFDFSRGSDATRVNSQGYIESVQVLSDELVQNGDFEDVSETELLSNGDFSNGSSTWVSISGLAVFENSTVIFENDAKIYTNSGADLSKIYKIEIDFNSISADGIQILVGNGNTFSQYSVSDITNNGNKIVHYSKFIGSQLLFIYSLSSNTSAVIDNVSVKEVGQNWTFDTGWGVAKVNGNLKLSSVNGINYGVYQQNILTSGKKYRVSYTISEYSSGSLGIRLGTQAVTMPSTTENGTFTVEGTANSHLIYFMGGGSLNANIDNISVKEVTDDTDIPRLDYTNAACPSLLLEPQRSNVITESVLPTGWTSSVTGVVSTKAPDNSNNATSWAQSSSPTGYYKGATLQSTGDIIMSVFAKDINNSGDIGKIRVGSDNPYFGTGSETAYIEFDVSTETATSTTSGVLDYGYEKYKDNWYRVWVKANVPSQLTMNFIAYASKPTGSNAKIAVWGYQVENGSYPTSYIPTNGLLVTRRADVCNNAGDSTIFNDSEGVLFAEISALADDLTNRSISLTDGTKRIVLRFEDSSNAIKAYIQDGSNVTSFTGDLNVGNTLEFKKVAVRYSSESLDVFIDGYKTATTTGLTISPSFNEIRFDRTPSADVFYGNTRQLLYFNEALSDAELEYITSADIDLTIHNYKGSLSKISATYEDVGVKDRLTKLF